MRHALTLLALFLAVAASAAERRFITEKDILRFEWVADPQVSPDGAQVAFVRVTVDEKKDAYQTSLWSVSTRGGAAPRRITNGPRDSAPRWSPDGKTLAFLRSGEKDGKPAPAQIWLLSMSGGEPRALTTLTRAVESIAWSPNGRTIAFTATTKPEDLEEKKEKKEGERESDVRVINQAMYRLNGAGYYDFSRTTHVWTVEVPEQLTDDAPKPRQLTTGAFDENEVTWSPDGARLYFTSTRTAEAYYDADDADVFAIPASGGDVVKIADMSGAIDRIAISPDGKWIAFRGSVNKPVRSYDQPDLWVASTTPGAAPRNLTATYDFDVLAAVAGDQRAPRGNRASVPVWSRDSKTLYVSTAEQGASNLERIDVAAGRIEPWTKAKHDVMSYSMAGGRTVALVSTPTIIGDLYSVNDDGSLVRLTNVNEKLWSELTLTEPEELWYPSFDGTKIHTWIQRPPNFDASKKYPMILNIHGGPHAAYGWTFDHEFQWMAAKGYVVLYPNPRGSSQYGQELGNSIQYAYPGDDHKDLMAGVDALIAKGSIDTKKLGITGGSGGGVLTNWAIGQTDRFAAAVSQRSIADWSTFWYTADFTLFQESWFRDAPWRETKDFAARSPITNVEKIKTPLMLIEGEADWRTPAMAGGEMMFRALKYLRRPVVMVRFPDESHELSRSGKPWHRVERLQHIVNWFDKWLLGAKMPQYDEGLR